MFCETSRFDPIYDLVLEAMGEDESMLLVEGIWVSIKNQSSLSEFAMHCKQVESDDNDVVLNPAMITRVVTFMVDNEDDVTDLYCASQHTSTKERAILLSLYAWKDSITY